MDIRTKIVATVGPACESEEMLEKLVRAGVDVFRVNFSHGHAESRQLALDAIRAVETRLDQPLGVMADLCGPKIRVGPIAGGSMLLPAGQKIVVEREPIEGTPEAISTTLAELVDHVAVGETILLDEGSIVLTVLEVTASDRFVAEVVRGGVLGSGKGVHLPETDLKLPALTEKDRADTAWIAERDFDFVALSFVQRPEDIVELRALLPADMRIVAKIEKPQALNRIDSIVAAADAIMVARGDLGVEMPLPQVPLAQKRLVKLCRREGKACIVATQMLETMTTSPLPTRAEVADITNAVLDGADALMLSGETAVGEYPVEAVEMMNDIAEAAEAHGAGRGEPMEIHFAHSPTTAAVAAGVRAIVGQSDVAAVAVFTTRGGTPGVLSQHRLALPILGMASSTRVVRQMTLLFGVRPVYVPQPEGSVEIVAAAERHVQALHLAEPGEKIVIVSGVPIGNPDGTNSVIVRTLA